MFLLIKPLWNIIKKLQPWLPTILLVILIIYVIRKVIEAKTVLFRTDLFNQIVPPGQPKKTIKQVKKDYVDALAARGETPSILESIALYLSSLNPFN